MLFKLLSSSLQTIYLLTSNSHPISHSAEACNCYSGAPTLLRFPKGQKSPISSDNGLLLIFTGRLVTPMLRGEQGSLYGQVFLLFSSNSPLKILLKQVPFSALSHVQHCNNTLKNFQVLLYNYKLSAVS